MPMDVLVSRTMAVPSTNLVSAYLLRALAGGETLALRDLRRHLADELALSPEERAEVVAEGRETRFDNRVGHARTLLVRLDLAEQPERRVLRITAAGRAVLRGDRTPLAGAKEATSAGLYAALDGDADTGRDAAAASTTSTGDVRAGDAPRPALPVVARQPLSTFSGRPAERVRQQAAPEPAAPVIPGPRALGRSIVVGLGDPIPDAWQGLPEVAVTPADLQAKTTTVHRLHQAWASRTPAGHPAARRSRRAATPCHLVGPAVGADQGLRPLDRSSPLRCLEQQLRRPRRTAASLALDPAGRASRGHAHTWWTR